jgi:hypothetical protein
MYNPHHPMANIIAKPILITYRRILINTGEHFQLFLRAKTNPRPSFDDQGFGV